MTPPSDPAAIIERKRADIARQMAEITFAELEALVAQQEPPRNFFAAVTDHPDPFHVSVIAEIERKGIDGRWHRPAYEAAFDTASIARAFYANGAAAISVNTDTPFSAGQLSMIEQVKAASPLPVLRRDFIIDPWQLWESRAAGADAVLLLAEFLTLAEIVDLHILAQRLGLTVLLEVNSIEHLLRVRPHVGFPHKSYSLLAISNRAPGAAEPDLSHTLRMVEMVEDTPTLVSDSGIHVYEDLLRLRKHNVRIALEGQSLMRADDPGRALAALLRRAYRKPDNPPTPPRGVRP